MKKLITLAILCLFLLVSCNGKDEPPILVNNENKTTTNQEEKTTDDGRTILRISTEFPPEGFDDIIMAFEATHPDVKIEWTNYVDIHSFGPSEYDSKIGTALMASGADDIIHMSGAMIYYYSNSGYFENLYEYMGKDEKFNVEDYYTNIFEAFEVDGKLYTFPTYIDLKFVGISDEFVSDTSPLLSEMDTISYKEMVDMYNSIEDKNGRYMYTSFDFMNTDFAYEYIDFENKKCYFDSSEFLDWINTIKDLRHPNKAYFAGGTALPPSQGGYDFGGNLEAENFIFDTIYYYKKAGFISDEAPFLNYEFGPAQLRFKNATPISDSNGKIMFLPSTGCFGINSNSENKELAWKFLEFINSYEVITDTVFKPYDVVCINRKANIDLCKDYYLSAFLEENSMSTQDLSDEGKAAIDKAVEYIDKICSMPMSTSATKPNIDYHQIFTKFVDGSITDVQAVQQIQNLVELVLLEK